MSATEEQFQSCLRDVERTLRKEQEETELHCPQCGEDCEELIEGYCQECTAQNYKILSEQEAQKRWWDSLPDEEKDRHIKNQLRFTC